MSFHISQRFIDELLEEDCPYMDLTVDALGIGREPGLLTCHPKAWRDVTEHEKKYRKLNAECAEQKKRRAFFEAAIETQNSQVNNLLLGRLRSLDEFSLIP